MPGLTDLSPFVLLVVAAILFAAGITKGIIGIGLPTVAIPLLSTVMPLPTAVAALAIPVLVTNLTQAFGTERIGAVFRVLWPILAGTAGGIVIGVHLLTSLSPDTLKPVIGTVLIGVAVSMLLAPKLHCPDRFATIVSPIAGIGSGILGGLAGQSVPIVSLYLLSRGITGNRFLQLLDVSHLCLDRADVGARQCGRHRLGWRHDLHCLLHTDSVWDVGWPAGSHRHSGSTLPETRARRGRPGWSQYGPPSPVRGVLGARLTRCELCAPVGGEVDLSLPARRPSRVALTGQARSCK
jgi:uncharacterized protein